MSKGVFAVYPQQTQSNAGILALPSIIKNQTMVIRLKSAYGSAVGISSVPTTLLLATNPVPTRFYSYQSVGVQTNAGYTMVIVPQQIFSGVGSGSATLGALFHS